jgi:hypothetical protein
MRHLHLPDFKMSEPCYRIEATEATHFRLKLTFSKFCEIAGFGAEVTGAAPIPAPAPGPDRHPSIGRGLIFSKISPSVRTATHDVLQTATQDDADARQAQADRRNARGGRAAPDAH